MTIEVVYDDIDVLVITNEPSTVNITEQAGNNLTVTQPANASIIEVVLDEPVELSVQENNNTIQLVNSNTTIDVVAQEPDAVIEVVTAGPQGAQGPAGMTTLDDLPAGTTVTAVFNTTWPTRPTARTDIVVLWIGGTEAPTGALTDDMWIRNV